MSTVMRIPDRPSWSREKTCPVPPMTHPLSKHWNQPSLDQMEFYLDRVEMTQNTLARLLDYSCSVPTGAYEGKMWRRGEPYMAKEPDVTWYLCWYGISADPDMVSFNRRRIEIIPG